MLEFNEHCKEYQDYILTTLAEVHEDTLDDITNLLARDSFSHNIMKALLHAVNESFKPVCQHKDHAKDIVLRPHVNIIHL